MNSTQNQLYALCQCDHYDLTSLIKHLSQTHETRMIRNVVQLSWSGGVVFIFDYGVCVFWQVPVAERESLLSQLLQYAEKPVTQVLYDEFTFDLNSKILSLKNDHISLVGDDMSIRLALSHGIAQSTKLIQYEAKVQNTITATEYIPNTIAATGKSGLRRKILAKLRGQLYLTKSDVMLHYDLLDIPDFFWEHPELQNYYTMVADYLETAPRITVLNKKLETIQDLLAMIGDEQKHAHSSLLEWIIIWLIAIDILIILIQEYIW